VKCPVDGVTLQMSERQGVEIDYCPDCRGVWLDRGELDKILARSDDDDDGRDDNRAGDRDRGRDREREREHRPDSGHYGKPKKKKSFFSEIMEGMGGGD
jgi:Zn-finger nucleic acid-binding protein